jgi:hypothetical protein
MKKQAAALFLAASLTVSSIAATSASAATLGNVEIKLTADTRN